MTDKRIMSGSIPWPSSITANAVDRKATAAYVKSLPPVEDRKPAERK
jgi:hypothetical protein